jgi:hypothetical protein
MMRKLSTWLIVALVAVAFAVGLTSGAFVAGGGSVGKSASALPTPPTTNPVTVQTVTAPVKVSPAVVQKAAAQAKPAATTVQTVSTPAKQGTSIPLPEANPMASHPPATSIPTPAPASPGPPPAVPSAPSASPPSTSDEPAQLEPSAIRAAASGALKLLQSTVSGSNETSASRSVIQELEQCLELINASSLPAGVEPPLCEAR